MGNFINIKDKIILKGSCKFVTRSPVPLLVSVPLSETLLSDVASIYGLTRDQADCCGTSYIGVFERHSLGEVMSSELLFVLEQVAKKDEAVELAALNNAFDYVSPSLGEPESLQDFLFHFWEVFSDSPLFVDQIEGVVDRIAEAIGYSTVRSVFSGAYGFAPSVDGSVDISVTPDGKYLVVSVSNYGA